MIRRESLLFSFIATASLYLCTWYLLFHFADRQARPTEIAIRLPRGHASVQIGFQAIPPSRPPEPAEAAKPPEPATPPTEPIDWPELELAELNLSHLLPTEAQINGAVRLLTTAARNRATPPPEPVETPSPPEPPKPERVKAEPTPPATPAVVAVAEAEPVPDPPTPRLQPPSQPAGATDPGVQTTFKIDGQVNVRPQYPSMMREQGREGKVIFLLTFAPDGSVQTLTFLERDRRPFNRSVENACRRWRAEAVDPRNPTLKVTAWFSIKDGVAVR